MGIALKLFATGKSWSHWWENEALRLAGAVSIFPVVRDARIAQDKFGQIRKTSFGANIVWFAFTLIELVVAITIIAIVGGVGP